MNQSTRHLPDGFLGSPERATPPVIPQPRRGLFRTPWFLWLLFALTLLSTTLCGLTAWSPIYAFETAFNDGSLHFLRRLAVANLTVGLQYSLSLLAILGAHEMGHYLMTLRYRIPATPPIFIPLPIQPIGTMGAVIAMDGSQADKKQIFDIGIAGPLAGLLVVIPVLYLGYHSDPMLGLSPPATFQFGQPLLLQWLGKWMQPDSAISLATISNTQQNPYLMAAWTGLLVTGLNLVPMSQLDGGHIAYGLLGSRAVFLAIAIFLAATAFVVYQAVYEEQFTYGLMLLIVLLVGLRHPPSRDDRVELGIGRQILGWLTLCLPILCIPANPIAVV